jgi:hypothetical protein
MVETVKTLALRDLGLLLGLLALPSAALAHRLDEYLQAALVNIEPGEIRLQINLTPGVAVAERVLAPIDGNHDGIISTNEAAAYCEALNHDLDLLLDGRKTPFKLTRSTFPEVSELKSGWGIIQVEFTATIAPLSAGEHKLKLKNRHLPELSVYLFNAAQPRSASIQITRQTRNKNQSVGEIRFHVDRGARPMPTKAAGNRAYRFLEWNGFADRLYPPGGQNFPADAPRSW